jgi:hypothetical protein
MTAVKVQEIRVVDRIVRRDDGSVVRLPEASHHVWFATTKGLHRFELMEGGWLRLRAESQDPALQLIRQACMDRDDIASELVAVPSAMQAPTAAAIKRQAYGVEQHSWTGHVTSYQHDEGVIMQSGVVTRDVLLTVQAFGVTCQIPSIEVNLGVVNDIIVNLP